jgi:hypothetical protein
MGQATDERRLEWTAHQKAGQVVAWLLEGEAMTTRDIADKTEMTWHGARYMMEMLSLTLPIVQVDGEWRWMVRQ